jgi:hypothetical protein
MRNLILVLIFCFFSSAYCQSKKSKNDLEEKHLLGAIKSTTTSSYMAKKSFGKVDKGNLVCAITFLYDQNGYTIENTVDCNNYLTKTIFNRNEKNKLISTMVYESSGNLKSKSTYEYNKEGGFIGFKTFSPEGLLISNAGYTRDEEGRLTESKTYDVNNNLISSNIFDEKEHSREYYSFDAKGTITNKMLFNWDENNNLIETEIYLSDGSLSMRTSSKYDNRNHIIEASSIMPSINNKPIIVNYLNEFDNIGNVIKVVNTSTIEETVIEYY